MWACCAVALLVSGASAELGGCDADENPFGDATSLLQLRNLQNTTAVGQRLKTKADDSKCLDWDYGPGWGTNAMLRACHDGDNQKWIRDGDSLKSARNPNKCLDWDYGHGNNVIVWDCNGGSNQKWYVDGTQLKSRRGTNKCMDYDKRKNQNSNVGVWDCWGGDNQQWHFEGPPAKAVTSGGGGPPTKGRKPKKEEVAHKLPKKKEKIKATLPNGPQEEMEPHNEEAGDQWEDDGPSYIGVNVKNEARCGKHRLKLGSGMNSEICAAIASGAQEANSLETPVLAYSLGQKLGVNMGDCWAELDVDKNLVAKWQVCKNSPPCADPVCPLGDGWVNDPSFDFFYLEEE